ncbi:hypothetical protein PC9H_002920 [Pleurotus ostreatus]|uniref:CBM21 domain-containing protein n=1 Tax=Pleurotus ostreatus TaxID=5322 RepID=A0A8H7A0G5_PLEOS|nr:uncharacterized protein PC9H_002920 [Pleurotus ostreatus]KAF7436094.1 hypothetical protein PC9H_002920 [Pleurotus ostreatus]
MPYSTPSPTSTPLPPTSSSSSGGAKAMNMNMNTNTNGADKGPGAFAPLPSLPRRNTSSKPASATKPRGKASLFHIRGDDDSNSDSDSNNDHDDDDARLGLDAFNYTTNLPAAPPPNLPSRGLPALKLNPNTSFPALQLRLNTDEKPPLVMRPRNHYSPFKNNSLSNINSLNTNTSTPSFNNTNLSGGAVPFPSSSPLSPQPPSQHIAFTSTPPASSTPSTAPQQSHPSAPAARPPLRPAVARTSSTPIFLSNGKPLKSSLKSSLPFAVNHPHTLSLSLSTSSTAAASSASSLLSAPNQSSSLKSSSSSPNVAAATGKTAYPKESVIPMIPSNYTRAVLGIYARGRSASAASAASTPGAAANALGAESVQRSVSEGAGHQQELSAESVSTSATTSSPPTPTTEHPQLQLQLQPHLRSLSLSALHPYFARASEHYDMGTGMGMGVDDLEHLRDGLGLGLGELEDLESLETLESLMTPKNVHFAENDGLASVRVFNRSGRPKSLLRGGRRHAHAEHANSNTQSNTHSNTNANNGSGDGDRDGGRDGGAAGSDGGGQGEGVLSGGETETETEGESSTGYSSSAYGSSASGYGYRASGYGASGWWGSASSASHERGARGVGGAGRRAWGWGDRQGGNGQGQGQGQGGEYPFPRVDAPSSQSSANTANAAFSAASSASSAGPSTVQPPQSSQSQSQSTQSQSQSSAQTTANSGSNSGYAYTIDASASSPIPTPDPNPAGNVFIESIVLDESGGSGKGNGEGNGGEGPVLCGTVLVRNVTFEKAVFVRFTLDGWDTTSEVAARWVCGATPGHDASANTNSALLGTLLARSPHSSWDRFAFRISLLAYSTSLHTRSLVLVARYLTGGGVGGGEWWDNNGGADYRVAFTKVRDASKEAFGVRGAGGETQGMEAKAKASGVRGSGSPWLGPLNVPRRVVVSAPAVPSRSPATPPASSSGSSSTAAPATATATATATGMVYSTSLPTYTTASSFTSSPSATPTGTGASGHVGAMQGSGMGMGMGGMGERGMGMGERGMGGARRSVYSEQAAQVTQQRLAKFSLRNYVAPTSRVASSASPSSSLQPASTLSLSVTGAAVGGEKEKTPGVTLVTTPTTTTTTTTTAATTTTATATPAQALPAEERRQAPTPPDTPPRTASPLPYTSNQAAASPSSPSSSYLPSSPRSGITISRTSPPTTPSKHAGGVGGASTGGQGQGMSGGVSAIPFPMKRSPVPSPAGSRTGSPVPSPTLTSPSLNPSLNPTGMGIPTPKPSPSSSLANMSDLSSLTHGNGMGGVGLSSSPPFSTMGMGSYWPWAGPPSTARPPLSRSTANSNNSSNSATPRSTMKAAPAKLGGLSPVSSSLASSLASYPQLQMRVNTSPGMGAGVGTASDDEDDEELVTPNDMGLHTAPRATGVGRSSSPPNEDTFSLSHSSGDEGLATPKPSHSALSSLSPLSPSSPFPPTTTTTTGTGTATPPTSPSSPSALAAANENGDIRGGLSRISGGGSDDELYKAFVRQWCFAAGPSAVVG